MGYDRQTALLVIHVQNDFADPAGNLYVEGGGRIIPAINRELARAALAGATIVYTQDWHPASTPHFAKWPPHCIENSRGAALHPALVRIKAATRILTGRDDDEGYSAFWRQDLKTGVRAKTALEDVLRRRGVRRVVFTGLATDYCVGHTALDALEAGFETVVLRDCVRAVDLEPGDGDRMLGEIAGRGGTVLTADQFHPPAELEARPGASP